MGQKMQEQVAIVVGSGPSGLAAAACLTRQSVPYIILEREDCYAPLWKKKAYDRLHLHLAKQFCQLPHMPFPKNSPTFISRPYFTRYLDEYVSHFKISPLYRRLVELANYNEVTQKWHVEVKNGTTGEIEEYGCRFLVLATGETTDAFIPDVQGLKSFNGEVLHSTQFKNGKVYGGKNVLVVGSGNSGMEIARDLLDYGAKSSIVIRSPIYVLSKHIVYMGMILFKYLPFHVVDSLMATLAKVMYGDLSQFGIIRPQEGGPFFLKEKYGKYPVIDAGTIQKIKSGEIQVLPAVRRIEGNEVVFEDGKSHPFDVILFATGFKRTTNQWLKADDLNDDGIPKQSFPNHWKGKNGLYILGLARRGLYGIAMDAQNIANDIKPLL